MKTYKLSDFELNKQSLKRKLNEFKNEKIKEKVKNILNKRTTKYNLETIEFVINAFYSDEYINFRKKSDQPLSVYYKTKNKEKYKKLKILINIKKNGNFTKVLEKEIYELVKKSQISYIEFDEYNKKLENIADKFGILPSEIYKISNKLETEWLNKIIK